MSHRWPGVYDFATEIGPTLTALNYWPGPNQGLQCRCFSLSRTVQRCLAIGFRPVLDDVSNADQPTRPTARRASRTNSTDDSRTGASRVRCRSDWTATVGDPVSLDRTGAVARLRNDVRLITAFALSQHRTAGCGRPRGRLPVGHANAKPIGEAPWSVCEDDSVTTHTALLIKRTATAVLLSALPIGLDVFDELFRRFGPLFGPILGVVA